MIDRKTVPNIRKDKEIIPASIYVTQKTAILTAKHIHFTVFLYTSISSLSFKEHIGTNKNFVILSNTFHIFCYKRHFFWWNLDCEKWENNDEKIMIEMK